MRVVPWFCLWAGLVGGAACSAVVDPDTGTLLNPPPLPCVPGTVNEQCACPPDGRTGTQTCNEQERYDECVCPSPAGAGSGGN